MNAKDIRPIPNYIAKIIKKKDENNDGIVSFYAYFTRIKGELVKITVACKHYKKQWFCKQVAVHGVHSDTCLVRDLEYTLMGYSIGWYDLGLTNYSKRFEDNKWHKADDKYYDPNALIVNRKFVLKIDEFKYSAIDKYPYADVFKYLRTYLQYPEADVCFIIDSNGKFAELYDFSSYLIEKGVKVVKARAEGRFDYGNIPKAPPDNAYLILRACAKGQPKIERENIEMNGKTYSIKN